MKSILLKILILVALVGCKKNITTPFVDHSSKYIQLDSGYTWVYQVDSIVYFGDGSTRPDTLRYQNKFTVTSLFTDNNGEQSYILSKFSKADSSAPWTYAGQIVETRLEDGLYRKSEDITTIALSLPIVEDKEWDGNLLNSMTRVDYYIEEAHKPFTVLGNEYDSTVRVYQDGEQNAINENYTNEYYAANYGLIQVDAVSLTGVHTSDPRGAKYSIKLVSFEK